MSANHPYRKSISFALFSAFLDQLQALPGPHLSAHELAHLLRRAALRVAVHRVNEDWQRITDRTGAPGRQLSLASDDSLLVAPPGTAHLRELSFLEQQELRRAWERITRGLPELQRSGP